MAHSLVTVNVPPTEDWSFNTGDVFLETHDGITGDFFIYVGLGSRHAVIGDPLKSKEDWLSFIGISETVHEGTNKFYHKELPLKEVKRYFKRMPPGTVVTITTR